MGVPDKIDEEEYVEGNGDWHRELWYSPRSMSFTFNKDDNFRLGTITIMGFGYTLFGKELFNTPKSLVRKFVSSNSNELMAVEDFSIIKNEPLECLDSDSLGIMFGSIQIIFFNCSVVIYLTLSAPMANADWRLGARDKPFTLIRLQALPYPNVYFRAG